MNLSRGSALHRHACTLAILFLLSVPLYAAKQRAVGRTEFEPRILFVGNSLTYTNNLPAILCRMAQHEGTSLTCDMSAIGGASLLDHLDQGIAASRIAQGHFTIVVLQQGPSALESSRVELLSSTKRFAELARAAGARPAMYAVWPSRARSFDFDRVAESYRLAAEEVDGLLFPAGSAWQAAWRVDPSIPLYGPDEFHPSVAGTYLAALVIYRVHYGSLPPSFAEPAIARGLAGADLGVSDRVLRILHAAAEESVLQSGGAAEITLH